jgi:hypothetical protein
MFTVRDRNLRDSKLTDSPAYRASGCRSVRQFKSLYLLIAIRRFNEPGRSYDASAQPRGEDDITLHATFNILHSTLDPFANEEIGRKILKLFSACSKWAL